MNDGTESPTAVAVVGMACRFPGAPDVASFWRNLRAGVESISRIADADLLAAGLPPETLSDPRYVKASGILDDVELFDARFFGFTPREAALLDPQHRLFLECAWEAIGAAGYEPTGYPGAIGVFAGAQMNSYLLFNVWPHRATLHASEVAAVRQLADKDFLATRVSYALNLKGPSLAVQTACSTSLVAVHVACRSLLGYECDMALAGGVCVVVPHRVGYPYLEGGILSPDGCCRAFDAEAQGTVPGSGAGVVLLKRLAEAVADGDHVHAVVLGSAINNDGSSKVGYTAPSVDSQAEAIAAALEFAGVDPETVGYVEAHGTGTPLGDPVEVAALKQAFAARGGRRRGFCALGSVKTNIGHVEAAAGVAGLIKAVLAVEHGEIPPSLHCRTPNPEIDFARSPFFVAAELRPWPAGPAPRRAGVSSFGIGGTNAHAVLEEAPARTPGSRSRAWQLVLLSCRTAAALERAAAELADHLGAHPDLDLADAAFTLQVGRRAFAHRLAVVCRDVEEARRGLADPARRRVQERAGRPVAFLFPGQGAQYPGMGAELYREEPVFRAEVDRCCRLLEPHLGLDLGALLFPPADAAPAEGAAARLAQTAVVQPALFVVEHALARLWMSWGVRPQAMLGHSIGEYVAACLAGVFGLEDALALVAERGRILQELPGGAMLAVGLDAAAVRPLLGPGTEVAAENAPALTVVSGPEEEILALAARLAGDGVEHRRLHTSHAFHSPMMEPGLAAFRAAVGKVRLAPPRIPYLSNLTGTWIEAAEATDPEYWVRHLRRPVRFSAGVGELLARGGRALLEVGPGRSLAGLVGRHRSQGGAPAVVGSLPPAKDVGTDAAFVQRALARLWLAGVDVDWAGYHAGERRLRVPLPTHPFERRRHWLEPPREEPAGLVAEGADRDDGRLAALPAAVSLAPPAAAAAPVADAAPGQPRPDLETGFVAPRTAAEAAVAAVFERVLGIDRIGALDDFFDLGGHSLMATQVVSRLRDAFGVELAIDDFFAAPTVAQLAPRVAAAMAAGPGAAEPPARAIPRAPRDRPLPLSFAQQRLWFLAQLEPGSPWYNMGFAVRFRGPLDAAALERGLGEILRRHEALRTTFTLAAAGPVQTIAPPAPFRLPRASLAGLAPPARGAEARRLALEQARQPFDLARGPLHRFRLLELAADDRVLALTVHHVVADGWSMALFVGELAALYGAFAAGLPSPLPEPPIQYADFAVWHRERLSGEVLARQLAYWRERLGGGSAGGPVGGRAVLELPTDRPRPPLQTFRGARCPVALGAGLTAALRALTRSAGAPSSAARRESATLFMVLLAGFAVLLNRWTGQEDLAVGTPVAGRDRSELEPLIGLFMNTLVLRLDAAGDPSFRTLLARVRETATGAYGHQDLPFERLVEELQPERDLARSPLFQAMLALENAGGGSVALPGIELAAEEIDAGGARFEWTFFLAEGEREVAGSVEYNTDLFDRATVARAVGHLENLLAGAAAAPDRPLSDLPLLAAAEEGQLLREWNATARAWPLDRPVHELIAEQAALRPDAAAVLCGGEVLTYGALVARAERWAERLRGLGIGPETPVGIHLERSAEMVVALLGTLGAGGAYLPLDPAYPRERLAWMLEDSGAPLVLTEERLRASLPPTSARVVCVDAAAPPAGPARLPRVPPASLAYAIYTSGSTGKPKGVAVPHLALANFLAAMREAPGLAPGDRLLAVTSLSFDIAGLELWLPLTAGASVDVVPRAAAADGPGLLARLRAGATALQATPSTWRLLVDSGWRGGDGLRALCGGEALPGRLAAEIGERAGELWNLYGPTETTIWSAAHRVDGAGEGAVALGRPIANTEIHLLARGSDRGLRAVPIGLPGEVYIGGLGLARGYLGRPDLTAERFVPDPFGGRQGGRLYRTGDLARRTPDGTVWFLGRADHQVKVRGFRIELGEVEAALAACPGVKTALVSARADQAGRAGSQRLVAHLVPEAGAAPSAAGLRARLQATLPEHMIPAAFVLLAELPLLPNGKVDRRALPDPQAGSAGSAVAAPAGVRAGAPSTALERIVAGIWQEVLGLERVGVEESFFELGGHSLLLAQVHRRLQEALSRELPMVELFRFPTVGSLARHLAAAEEGSAGGPAHRAGRLRAELRRGSAGRRGRLEGAEGAAGDVAIVGMAARFPGAPDLAGFWDNLRRGVESVSTFGEEELLAAGVEPETFRHPSFINAKAVIDGADLFDAAFFGFTPREAEVIDPQQRVFLELAWHALEDAGCDPAAYPGAIGVFAGAGMNTYVANLYSHPDLLASLGGFQLMISNDKDFLPTRVSYKLDLTGPSLNIQTACSTSLVAVHLACQHLLHGECDLALAGGVTIGVPLRTGSFHDEGGILARDGHCRAFDERAAGTVVGNGAGIVALKRLADAVADGDSIYAVVKGSAINNDGAQKVGYTAPSVEGQAAVVAEALAVAGVGPETLSYVEAHGTGTALGDPIEVAALTQVFRAATDRRQFCALGSVKSNIGHTDTAAGVAGLIKTALALEHRLLPPSLHFERPNPQLELPASPFHVNARAVEWSAPAGPRRAGVSAFGIGGTNAHVVVEEPPPAAPSGPSRPAQLLVLSARTAAALESVTDALARRLEEDPALSLPDVAFTLATGRRRLPHRRTLVCRDVGEAAAALAARDPRRVLTHAESASRRPVVFMFPGGGAQYAGMGLDLYRAEPAFRAEVDRCLELAAPHLDCDLAAFLFPAPEAVAAASRVFERTSIALPAIFTLEYALARLLVSWGLRPQAMIGHSLGEYVAACLAGVVSLADALAMVALRGRLFETLPEGAMLSLPLPEAEVLARLGDGLSIAAVNGPAFCVASGTVAAIGELEARLAGEGVEARRLHIAVAAHSALVEPILRPFGELVGTLALRPPEIPYVSNVTGTWIRPEEATDPAYWVRHLRQTVRFGDGIGELAREADRVLLEVGPGSTLSTLALQHPARPAAQTVLSTVRHAQDPQSDVDFLLGALGRLWLAGATVDWPSYWAGERRRRLRLPAYPFERRRFWVERRRGGESRPASLAKRSDLASWFYAPVWKQTAFPAAPANGGPRRFLLLLDPLGWGDHLAALLAEWGHEVATAVPAVPTSGFARLGAGKYAFDPRRREGWSALLAELAAEGRAPQTIVHLGGLWELSPAGDDPAADPTTDPTDPTAPTTPNTELERGFFSLLSLVQALAERPSPGPVRIEVLSHGVHAVSGDEACAPDRAAVLGICRVVPQEQPEISCRSIDVDLPDIGSHRGEERLARLASDLLAEPAEPAGTPIAYRGSRRWVEELAPLRLEARPDLSARLPAQLPARLRERGVYLITGGLGGVGLAIAAWLARTAAARLVLVGRSAFPAREEWDAWRAAHGESDRVSRRIARLRSLEELGAEVLVERADAADLAAMGAAVERAVARFGAVHGVIHAAGLAAGGMVQRKTREAAAAVLAPKLGGARVLATLFAGARLDFLALFSALNSVLGGFGQVDYCAASAGLDAWAGHLASRGLPAVAVDWDTWREVGMVAEIEVPPDLQEIHRRGLEHAMLTAEGVEAFGRALGSGLDRVVVSTRDLRAVLERGREEATGEEPGTADGPGRTPVAAHARPTLGTAFAAPETEVEQAIAGIWQELLGIAPIGLHDNFFELGGHSLLATQIASRLRDRFQVEFPLAGFFAAPTVAGQAAVLERQQAAQTAGAGADRLALLLDEVEGMSDAEIDALVAAEEHLQAPEQDAR